MYAVLVVVRRESPWEGMPNVTLGRKQMVEVYPSPSPPQPQFPSKHRPQLVYFLHRPCEEMCKLRAEGLAETVCGQRMLCGGGVGVNCLGPSTQRVENTRNSKADESAALGIGGSPLPRGYGVWSTDAEAEANSPRQWDRVGLSRAERL